MVSYKEPLKPLRNLHAFDGEKSHVEMPRDIPLPRTCNHKDVQIKGNELRCKCGCSWGGRDIQTLYFLLKNHSS